MSITHPPQPVSDGGHLDPKHLWETAVCLATTRARQALPDSNGRIDKAQQLVLDGSVEVLDDHTARVTSQRDGETVYYVVNGTCQCRDFPNAPQLLCKHRIARGIAVRARAIAKELGDVQATAISPQPAIPQEFIVQIQGRPFITFQGLLHLAHQQGLLSLTEEVTHVTDSYVLAQARAEFHDGRVFRGVGDSTPDNVGAKVKPHWRRMAGTRAKARALRDALNIAMVAVEELD
jgi:hypothetical protein